MRATPGRRVNLGTTSACSPETLEPVSYYNIDARAAPRRYKLGDDGAAAVGRAMRSSLRLTQVGLATCGLGDGAGVSAIAGALAANNRLREVDLSGESR